jgi:hypothetical protein
MKKWLWITVPAVAVGLGLIFAGGAALAQTPNSTATGVNWTAMYNYCRNVIAGNNTAADADYNTMRNFCQNATASGNFGPGMMGGRTGMMGNGSPGRGMMGW